MPSFVIQRKATQSELESLANLLRNAPSTVQRWKQGFTNAMALWAATSLGALVLWSLIAWVACKVADAQWGLSSPVGLGVIALVIPVCGVYAGVSSVRWVKGRKDHRPLYRADMQAGEVREERYAFVEAKRFQESEHGGLIYFLRTEDQRVFTWYDGESQDLGAQEQDPLSSSFCPMSALTMVRFPRSDIVISHQFSGVPLESGSPIEITIGPEEWPESETYCDIPWAELESRLGA